MALETIGMIAGGCRCGDCRYALAADVPPPVYCCHCEDCQSWSGSAFSEQAVVRAAALAATGPVIEYAYINRSGGNSSLFVCATCHARLWSVNDRLKGFVVLRAGTLDASASLEPRLHIWTSRKQPWIALGDDVPAFAENAPPADFIAILSR